MARKNGIDCEGILVRYREGLTKDYDIMLSELESPDLTPATLIAYLRGLKGCILLLGRHCEALVGILLKLPWLKQDAAVVKEYQSFLVNLLSAHTIYLKPALNMIVKHFYGKQILKGDEMVSECARLDDEVSFRYLHSLLKTIVQIVPMSPTVLVPLVGELFPYMTKHSYVQACYVTNLLHITTYLPKHRSHILLLVVDKMTKLDVRSPRSAIEEAEDGEDDENEEDQFEMDEVDMELSERTSQGSVHSDGQERPMSHKEAERLDVLMAIMFRYIYSVCHPQGQLDWEATKLLYRELLLVFERILLRTHASCHVQFLLFYICSFKEAIVEGFIDYLWKKVQDLNSQGVFRQVAVAYLASLLARAKYIHMGLVQPSLELMAQWCHDYLAQACYTTAHANLAHHGTFYSICQAIFYVIAFRQKDLLLNPKGFAFAKSLKLQTLVTSRLNPLKMCLPIVVNTFASIARSHQIAFCDTILERNKRIMLPVEGSSQCSHEEVINPLDSFFPFDPYLLNRSGKYIMPLYQEYEGAPPADPAEKCTIEEDKLYEMESESVSIPPGDGWGLVATSPSQATDFMMYGVSPGFKTAS